jgi:hypothetical protein
MDATQHAKSLPLHGTVMISLLVLVLASGCINGQEGVDRLFQKVELSFSDEPALGREVTLTLSVTAPEMNEESWKMVLSKEGTYPEEYYTEIILPEGFELVEGNLSSESYTSPGDTEEFSVEVRAVKEGNWEIGAWAGPATNREFDRDNLYVSVSESGATVSREPFGCMGADCGKSASREV